MSKPSLNNRKLILLQRLAQLGNSDLLNKIEPLLNEGQEDFSPLSQAQLLSIDQGLADLEAGNRIPHDEARKLYGPWL